MGSLKEWNRTTFRNLFHCKRRWLARLNGIQRILAQRPIRKLEKLEEKLIQQYNQILHQEEVLWCQKARVNWLQYGVNIILNSSILQPSFVAGKRKSVTLWMMTGSGKRTRQSLVTWSETIFIISIRRKTQAEIKETCSMAFLLLQKEGSRPYLAQSVLLK